MKLTHYFQENYWRSLLATAFLLIAVCAPFTFAQDPPPISEQPAGQPGAQQPKPAQPRPTPTPARRPPSELQKALDEFRVQMNSFSSGGGKVKAVGKQNRLTGRLYENFRNDFLDAIPHEVRQRGGTRKSLLRRNQFGFSLAGPVWLPYAYDGRGKTFFSLSFEGTRERIAQSALFTLPTAQQQLGAFSDYVDSAGQPVTVYDPATTRPNPRYDPTQPVSLENLQYLRDPFPNNTIPANRLDPVARALVALYPKPNTAVGPFLQNNYWINSPFENRADGIISKVDHRVGEKQQLSANLNLSRGLRRAPEYFPGPGNSGAPSYSYENGSVSVQDVYTASPKVVWTFRLSAAHSRTASLTTGDENTDYPRQLGLAGAFSKVFPRFFFSGNYLSLGPRSPLFRDSAQTYSGSASVSLNRKAHTLRVSFLMTRRFVNSLNPTSPAGQFIFNTSLTGLPGVRNTGNGFASFLLGMVNRAEQTLVLHPSYYSKNFIDTNVSDEYRIRNGVTLNFNVSLEMATPRVEKYNRQSTVSLKHINPANGRPGALIFAGRDGQGRALQPFTARLEPFLSLSVNPWNDRRTVVRTSYSLSFEDYPLYGRHFGTQGFNAYPVFNSTNDQLQEAFLLRNGLPLNFTLPPTFDPAAANGTEPDYVDPSGLLPAQQQWTLSIQRELPRALMFELRYTGWRATHQWVDSFIRLNSVPVENLKYRDQLYDDAFRNSLRPFPQYRIFDLGGVYPGGDGRSHALTATVDQRLSHGLYGRASYRLAKQIDNYSTGAAQDPDNLRVEKAISDDDITHSLQLSFTYELPLGKGKRLLNDARWLGRTLGNWSLSGITTMRGGRPLVLRPYFNRTGNIVNSLRVNVVPGVNPKVEQKSPERWFNPEAFAQPDDFTLGNGPRTHPTLRSPGAQFHHLSMTKRMPLTAETSLELVVEAFNFPNHANWNDPDTRIGPPASPNLNAGKIIGSTGGRVMQMGLRILF